MPGVGMGLRIEFSGEVKDEVMEGFFLNVVNPFPIFLLTFDDSFL